MDALYNNLFNVNRVLLNFEQHNIGKVKDLLRDGTCKFHPCNTCQKLFIYSQLFNKIDSGVRLHVKIGKKDHQWILLLIFL